MTIGELKRLIDGVSEEEVQRVRAGLKSAVIMQEESTSSRAGALASDWYYLGRVRSMDEIQQAIDAIMGGKPPLVLFTTLARDRRLFFKFFNSGLLDRALELTVQNGGSFKILSFELGTQRQSTSKAEINVSAPSAETLDRCSR